MVSFSCNNILIVCMGNICRSPTAERLMRQYLSKQIKVHSAGLHALVGQSVDDTALRIAENHKLDLKGHVAQQIDKNLIHTADLVLVMEKKHIEYICQKIPEVRGKILLFGYWLNNNKEILDPYKKSDEAYQSVFISLDAAAKSWAEILNGEIRDDHGR